MYKFEDLDYAKPLYAITEFKFNGRTFKPGELFPWTTMAVSKHIVAKMWTARKVRHTVEAAVVTEPAAVVTEPAAVVTEPAQPAVVTEPAQPAQPAQPTGTPATLAHTGAGWYNIEVAGLGVVNPQKIKGKLNAEKWAAENNYTLA